MKADTRMYKETKSILEGYKFFGPSNPPESIRIPVLCIWSDPSETVRRVGKEEVERFESVVETNSDMIETGYVKTKGAGVNLVAGAAPELKKIVVNFLYRHDILEDESKFKKK